MMVVVRQKVKQIPSVRVSTELSLECVFFFEPQFWCFQNALRKKKLCKRYVSIWESLCFTPAHVLCKSSVRERIIIQMQKNNSSYILILALGLRCCRECAVLPSVMWINITKYAFFSWGVLTHPARRDATAVAIATAKPRYKKCIIKYNLWFAISSTPTAVPSGEQ